MMIISMCLCPHMREVRYDHNIYVCIETFGGKHFVANVYTMVRYDHNIYVYI